ncbi:glycosyltransferase [Xylocopilactobacillus apicola]|uniref:Poly(Glycerol-phosphate) alpha-glucosyltransferase n=1 Tax=Xylocopilactobacillus apicola TaxID=2932184 RepID=A0AAU9DQ06_9LACO|nr:glycosyltransferase [Xylocopilactobacillus apicola]BDR57919.1 poly(glycerol-phosphate) alpha-glucosyltransferase [Xylocopilactobacillus apicola]
MNFFITNNVSTSMSGIEHAQIKRLHLFNSEGGQAMIVTVKHWTNTHTVLKINGIPNDQHINAFDFYQGTHETEKKENTIKQYQDNEQYEVTFLGPNGQTDLAYRVVDKDDEKKNYIIQTNTGNGQITSFIYMEPDGQSFKKYDYYDERGFLSSRTTIDDKRRPIFEEYFDLDGNVVIEIKTIYPRGVQKVSSIMVKYQGETTVLGSTDEFQTKFLDDLNLAYGHGEKVNNFFSDRMELTHSVAKMKTPAYKYMMIHSGHAYDPHDVMHSRLNENYEYGLRHAALFDGFIVPTHQQQLDLRARFSGVDTRVYSVSVGIADPEIPYADFEQRDHKTILAVARLSPEKRLEDMVKAFNIVHKEIPDAKLDIWGYAMNDFEVNKLLIAINRFGLQETVRLRGYTKNIAEVYDHSICLANTSKVEGAPLSMVEAINHGVPIVAYDIKYGAPQIIEEGENGYLIKEGDYKEMAKIFINILKDPFLQKTLSTRAYESASRFYPDAVWQMWQQVLNHEEPVE